MRHAACRRMSFPVVKITVMHGRKWLTVKHLLITHLHLDNIFGNPFMIQEFGIKAEANQADEFWIDEAPKQSRMFGFQLPEAPVALGKYLYDGDIITFGNSSLEAIHVPGHSPGSLVYYFKVDNRTEERRVGIGCGNTVTTRWTAEYV